MRSAVTGVMMLAAAVAVAAQTSRAVPVARPSGRRIALVIGNDAYPSAPLRNAVNDARSMAAALTNDGFRVDLLANATLRDIQQHTDAFVQSIQTGDVALVFYSGHGFQLADENYIVPIDFNARDQADAPYQGYSASRIVDRVSASTAAMTIVILDACRTNPFQSSRGGTRGLAAMESGRGTLIAFATSPNRTASDNPNGRNGLFTTYVLQAMNEPGLGIEQVFSRARQLVYEASQGEQVPWLVSSIIGDFSFRPTGAPAAAAAAPVETAPSPSGAAGKPNVAGAAAPSTSAPTSASSALTFAAGRSGLILNYIKPEAAADFEAAMRGLNDAMVRSPDPTRRKQLPSWKTYRASDPGPNGTTIYAFEINPAVWGADYNVSAILVEGLGPEGLKLAHRYYDAYSRPALNSLQLELVQDMSTGPWKGLLHRYEPATPTSAPVNFTGDAGLILHFIKPDHALQFEVFLAKLKAALRSSEFIVRRKQALAWKVYKVTPTPDMPYVVYVFQLNPVVAPSTDYNMFTILQEATPTDLAWRQQLLDCYAQPGINKLSLTPLK